MLGVPGGGGSGVGVQLLPLLSKVGSPGLGLLQPPPPLPPPAPDSPNGVIPE